MADMRVWDQGGWEGIMTDRLNTPTLEEAIQSLVLVCQLVYSEDKFGVWRGSAWSYEWKELSGPCIQCFSSINTVPSFRVCLNSRSFI